MANFQRIGVLGCGNMGGSLVRGMAKSGKWDCKDILVFDANTELVQSFVGELGVTPCASLGEMAKDSSVIVLGIKPQIFPDVAEDLDQNLQSGSILISIMAGLSTEKIKGYLNQNVRVVRTMPNLPLSISKGVTAIAVDGHKVEIVEGTKNIFSSVGSCVEVQEEQLDAVTGVSGSGPMYVFEFVDAMIHAGIESGLSESESKILALETLKGAVGLLESSDETPEAWTKKVCSPGGTTLAGLEVLNNREFKKTVTEAVKAAVARSVELRG